MLLRDPVHGLVSFEGEEERVVLSLLDTREVQRLRRVRQLGFASFVFPAAEHTRFAHALGAAYVMSSLLRRLRDCMQNVPAEQLLSEQTRRDALAAAMLHDVGHGPFSHLFEDVLPYAKHHEQWTKDIIEDPKCEVHQRLETISKGMAARVVSLLQGKHPLRYLCQSISGTLDVDRADYLLRDSHMTGVRYGLYDLDWILRALTVCSVQGQWVLGVEGRKGLPAIESFFLGRHFMYQQVYQHKTTRAAEALMRAIFRRVAELIQEGQAPEPMPIAFAAAVLGEPLSTQQYLTLDDVELLHCIDGWSRGADKELALMCDNLRNRRLPKTIPLPNHASTVELSRYEQIAREIAQAQGFRADLHVTLDMPSDIPYAEDEKKPADGLWVVLGGKPSARLGEMSFLLGELKNKEIVRPRLIVPAAIRDQVAQKISVTSS